jgi:subtilisin family serine protease
VIPANKVAAVLALPGVVAVQSDQPRHVLTDSSPQFLGATTLYPRLGGTAHAGAGVIVGLLDSGIWPEHSSFADQGILGTPPPKADGTPRACDFGDNPLTKVKDPFRCNHKVIGGKAVLATYLADPGRAKEERFHTARDSSGHGTHTASTAAGDVVSPAKLFGVDRGPISGLAPGAWLSIYKVCGLGGCFPSDSVAAIAQAVKDGVKVINYSISGGTQPLTDPAELAFLDAYGAGVFVAAAAGNDGPAAGTTQHLGPWVTTVAASTQMREFTSRLTVRSKDGTEGTLIGSTVTRGAGPLPVVNAADPPYRKPLCDAPAPPHTFTGKIVVCERGSNARVEKGFNVKHGNAAGMILYNPTTQETETDNHFLPTIHLPRGTALLAFLRAHDGVTASFTGGYKAVGKADVLAAFSSRGPIGDFIKPDVSAPGVQILAGMTPVPEETSDGPPGEYFQALAGTSMASPHVAGAGALLRALHPQWTPGQVHSALMTSAKLTVVKEDEHTPAGPFEVGSGRISLDLAANPGLTFDETADRMRHLTDDDKLGPQLNVPSIYAPSMPGRIDVTRTARNVSGRQLTYEASVTAPGGAQISVWPRTFTVAPGGTVRFTVVIRTSKTSGRQVGQVRLVPQHSGDLPTVHLPVAFVPRPADVTLTNVCGDKQIRVGATTRCTVTATNATYEDTTVDLASVTNRNLALVGANGQPVTHNQVKLAGIKPGNPSIAPGTALGYRSLRDLGIKPTPIKDEELINYDVPAFMYGGQRYTRIGVDSNGYVVVGGGDVATDNNCCLPAIPDKAKPNNVLAPFWTDLDGDGAPGVLVAKVTEGNRVWTAVQWQVNVFGTKSERHFQLWIGSGDEQTIAFAYDPKALPAKPGDLKFVVGAENVIGSAGATLPANTLPTQDLKVTSTTGAPGGRFSYEFTVRGARAGGGTITTTMRTPTMPGVSELVTPVRVRRARP